MPATNAGYGTGTSLDMSTVVNFAPTDTIDISVEAFGDLLRSFGRDPQPLFGKAIFSNLVSAGGTVTVDDADVLLLNSTSGYANAAAVASALLADPITFANAQSGTYNHYIVAYQDLDGDVRIADMDIHLGSGSSFDTTAGGATLSISDMLELSSVISGVAAGKQHHFPGRWRRRRRRWGDAGRLVGPDQQRAHRAERRHAQRESPADRRPTLLSCRAALRMCCREERKAAPLSVDGGKSRGKWRRRRR